MAENQIGIIIKAQDLASKVIDQVSQKVGGLYNSDHMSKMKGYYDGSKKQIDSFITAGTIGFAALGAGVMSATNTFNDFEKQMSSAKSVLGLFGNDTATQAQFKQLSDLAIKLGADSKFTAKEAAEGITVLGQAGFSTQEIMQSLKGTMDLAAATNISIADSADIASSVLRQYGIATSETSRVMNVLAKTSIDSNADILDLRESFKYFGPTAKAMGISLEESAAMMGIMANAGIKGTAATTALGTSLTRLSRPTKAMSIAMKEANLQAFDAQGNFVGMASIIEQLSKHTEGWTQKQKLATISAIFGAESQQEIFSLLAAGSDKLRQSTEELKNSAGTIDKMAKTQLDNTRGSIELLNGAIDSLKINIGQNFSAVLRKLANDITPVVENITKWTTQNPQLTQTIITFTLGLTGLIASLGALSMIANTISGGLIVLRMSLVGVMGAFNLFTKILAFSAQGFFMLINSGPLILANLFGILKTATLGVSNVIGTILRVAIMGTTSILGVFGKALSLVSQGMMILINSGPIVLAKGFGILRTAVLLAGNAIGTAMRIISMGNPWIAGLIILVTGLYLAWKNNFFGIRDITAKVWNWCKGAFDSFTKNTLPGIIAKAKEVKKWWDDTIGKLGDTARKIGEDIGTAFLNFKNTASNALQGVIDFIQKVIDKAGQIGNAVSKGISDAKNAIKNNPISVGIGKVGQFGQNIGAGIGGFLAGARAKGGPVSGGSAYLVGEEGPEIFVPDGSGKIIPNGIFDKAKNKTGTIDYEKLTDEAKKYYDTLRTAGEKAFASVSDGLKNNIEKIKDYRSKVKDTIQSWKDFSTEGKKSIQSLKYDIAELVEQSDKQTGEIGAIFDKSNSSLSTRYVEVQKEISDLANKLNDVKGKTVDSNDTDAVKQKAKEMADIVDQQNKLWQENDYITKNVNASILEKAQNYANMSKSEQIIFDQTEELNKKEEEFGQKKAVLAEKVALMEIQSQTGIKDQQRIVMEEKNGLLEAYIKNYDGSLTQIKDRENIFLAQSIQEKQTQMQTELKQYTDLLNQKQQANLSYYSQLGAIKKKYGEYFSEDTNEQYYQTIAQSGVEKINYNKEKNYLIPKQSGYTNTPENHSISINLNITGPITNSNEVDLNKMTTHINKKIEDKMIELGRSRKYNNL